MHAQVPFLLKEKCSVVGWGGKGQVMFYRTFLTMSCKLYGKHGLTQVSVVISNYKTEHGAIFKKIFSQLFSSPRHHWQGVFY